MEQKANLLEISKTQLKEEHCHGPADHPGIFCGAILNGRIQNVANISETRILCKLFD